MRSAAVLLLLASACALALVAAQPSWGWTQPPTYHTATPIILHDISNASSNAAPTRAVACGLVAGCALGRVVPISAAAWTDFYVPQPTLAAEAVVPWAALPAGAPTLPGIGQRLAAEVGAAQTWMKLAADRIGDLAEQTRARLQRGLAAAAIAVDTARALVTAKAQQLAGAAAAALGRARAAAADAAALLHGRSWRVADAAAAALKQTRARLQRGLAAAATAVFRARALLPAKIRQLAGVAVTALGHAWPDPEVYPLHATAELLVRAAATAGDAAAWARPAAQAAAAQCRERALLAALRGRCQAMHAAGGLLPWGQAPVQWHGTVCAFACCCLHAFTAANQACRLLLSYSREGHGL